MTTRDFLPRLKRLKRHGNGWMALCPAHNDHSPSLSVKDGDNGGVLLHCFAGCPTERICDSLGIDRRQLASYKPHTSGSTACRIVATYDYSDESGNLLFQVVRYEPKQFRQRRPNTEGDWVWNLKGVRRVLYRLPDIIAADDSAMVFIVEGEKDVDRLVALGLVATTNSGGAGKWRHQYNEPLRNRHICIPPDNDDPGRKHAEHVAKSLRTIAASVRILSLPNLPAKGDVSIWLDDAGGTADELERLAASAPIYEREEPHIQNCAEVRESDEETLKRLAALPLLEYERQRDNAAQTLGCRTPILDKLVSAKRCTSELTHGVSQGSTLNLANTEVWLEPVDGAEVLNEAAEALSHYIAMPEGAADVLALWCAHAHAFDSFLCTPRLNISSPDKQCGKTTLRDVLAVLVPRPLSTENLSVAVLFRVIESHKPTVLADECDVWLRDNEELRGLLNAGHRRGGQALRCEGESREVRAFQVFAPAVLCGIGELPGTLHDRSIVIRLERAKPGEVSKRFDFRHTEREQELCQKLARFCADNHASLEACDPTLPAGAFNRLADNWRPLFAIAEVAGGDWPERATSAFLKLISKTDAEAEGIGVMLLADIRHVFREAKAERLFSRQLVEELCAITDHPWTEAHRGRPITEPWLARRLRHFSVRPRTLRVGEARAKGYELACFQEAFERYLPPESEYTCDNVTSQRTSEVRDYLDRDAGDPCHAWKTPETSKNIALSRRHESNTASPVNGRSGRADVVAAEKNAYWTPEAEEIFLRDH